MTNENNNTSIQETGINRQFFKEVISNLPEEDQKHIGEFSKEFKNDTVGEILKVEDKDKIKAYDSLNIKDLPTDWEFKLSRLKHLEKLLNEYEPKVEELKTWTDFFGERKPPQIEDEIKSLEIELEKAEEDLSAEKENHSLTTKELSGWKETFLNQTPLQVKQKLTELENKVKEWTQFFDYRELPEIKQEIEELKKRPDISISTQKFWDDYAQRKSLEQSKLDSEELEKAKSRAEKYEERNRKLRQVIHNFLKNEKIKRYALTKPVQKEQALARVVGLLEETKKGWLNYLEGEDIVGKDLKLGLVWEIEKNVKERAYQIIAWIEEALETKEYEKLFERWNGGKEYRNDEENDPDGSLCLLDFFLKKSREEEETLQITAK